MKRKCTTVIALAMAFTLAVPAITGTDVSAAGKKPKLTLKDGETIIKGKSKKFKVKNVKKSNVKTLKVKVARKDIAKLMKKTKVNFTLKGIGGGYTAVTVTVKLKKPQAGKKVYKFKDITIACGSDEAPIGVVIDTVTGSDETAIVLKAGTDLESNDFAEDNYLSYDIYNKGDIGARNIMVTWYEDGKELPDWTNDAAGRMFRPNTKDVVAEAPASGSAADVIAASGSAASGTAVSGGAASGSSVSDFPLPPTHTASGAAAGLVEHEYYAVFENMLSGKKTESQRKICRIVPQGYIDLAMVAFERFVARHPYKSVAELPTDATKAKEYMHEFIREAHGIGMCLGMTTLMNDFIARTITELNDPAESAKFLAESVAPLSDKIAAVGKYLGIRDDLVTAYLTQYGLIAQKSITDKAYDLTQLHYK